MNIKFVIDYPKIEVLIEVELSIISNNITLFKKTIKLPADQNIIDVNFNIEEFKDQTLNITFATTDVNIIKAPLTIKQIILDNFYSLKKLAHSGSRNFDQKFLDYAKKKNIYLDTTVNDDNCLQFTGSLVYSLKWPFFKNIFI